MTRERPLQEAAATRRPWIFALLAFAALLALNAGFDLFGDGRFFALEIRDGRLFGSLVDVMRHASVLALAAIGMTLVIATGGVDLSVGAVAAIAGATAAPLCVDGRPFPIAIAAALLVACALGLSNGLLVTKLRVQPIVATLILMVAGRGIAQVITAGQIVTFDDDAFSAFFNGNVLGLPRPLAITATLVVVLSLLAKKTNLAPTIEAVGTNDRASLIAGVAVDRTRLFVYALCAVLAGLVGIFEASEIRGADAHHAGLLLELDAIFAVVVGGTVLDGGRFTLRGSLLGALLLETLTTTLYGFDVPSDVAPLPKAGVILVTALFTSARFRSLLRRGAPEIGT